MSYYRYLLMRMNLIERTDEFFKFLESRCLHKNEHCDGTGKLFCPNKDICTNANKNDITKIYPLKRRCLHYIFRCLLIHHKHDFIGNVNNHIYVCRRCYLKVEHLPNGRFKKVKLMN